MNTNLQKLIDILCELKDASIKSTIDTVKSTMHKYDMLFLGEKFNSIYSIELIHSLNTVFNFDISDSELNSLIPAACNLLNMRFEPMVTVNAIDKSNPDISYKIILRE